MKTPNNRSQAPRRRGIIAGLVTASVAATMCATPAFAVESNIERPNAGIGYPTFTGSDKPIPDLPTTATVHGQLEKIYQADLAQGAGTSTSQDFWIDKMLTRTGNQGGSGETNQFLFSRGRAAYMFTHQPQSLGFAGSLGYWHETGYTSAYTITLHDGETAIALQEVTAQRKQTPSYWKSVHTNAASGITITQTKFMTNENVLVTNLSISGGDTAKKYTVRVNSPIVSGAQDNELHGTFAARNNITTVFPVLSGQGFTAASNSTLEREYTPGANPTDLKVQMGLTTTELPSSQAEYEQYSELSSSEAFTKHVTEYNKWWTDNIPYIDTPEDNIDKTLFYRWWLMRFNTLDANVSGNDYQFPTAIEGVLGYNNAIVLTSGMFIDDQKYLRDPSYAYGTWLSAGEVARSGKFVDNPGSPANWSNSYTQYITEAGWRSYLLHGGPQGIAENLAVYGENDVKGLIDAYDSNKNYLLEYDWGAMTGNDADAVSFDWARQYGNKNNNMDRAESAYLYSNALASAGAYRVAGNESKAKELEEFAANVKSSIMTNLWDSSDNLLKHKQVDRNGVAGELVDWKEINNYYPFTVGLVPQDGDADFDAKYLEALRLWEDSDEYPIFPFYTANQADAAARGGEGSNNFSVINSTVTFRMLSSVLRNYENDYVSADYYKKLLYWNAWAHYINGDNRLPDQNEFWNTATANTEWGDKQGIGYRSWIHHTMLGTTNFTVIEDVAGLRTREDNLIELDPINVDFEHFMVENIRYRNKDLTIVWDQVDGNKHYGADIPEGYSVFLDGELAFTTDTLGRVVYDPESGTIVEKDAGVTVLEAHKNAVSSLTEIEFSDDARIVDLMAKAGQDVRSAPKDAANLAENAAVTTSFEAKGFEGKGAVDGTTINEPFWGTVGSTSATDSIEIDLGSTQTFDDVRVFFYRTSSSDLPQGGRQAGTRQGYAAPKLYQIEYFNGGQWKTIEDQKRTPSAPAGNLNTAEFSAVTGSKIRVTVTHADGAKTGIKEIQVRNTGVAQGSTENAAPFVKAWIDQAGIAGGTVKLIGQVGDDAKPAGSLTTKWTVTEPAGAQVIFDKADSASTTARFTQSGTYTLTLTASDSEKSSTAHLYVTVDVASGGTNVALTAKPTTDFVAGWNSINAINDGKGGFFKGGNNSEIWATWPGGSATRWIQYEWDNPVRINSSSIDFWSDQPAGAGSGVAPPTAWKLEYWDGTQFVAVANPSEYTVKETATNEVTFDAVTTTRVRATLTASPGAAVGATEWRVFAPTITGVENIDVRTSVGVLPQLPTEVEVQYDDGSRAMAGVIWSEVTEEQVAADGSFDVVGVVGNSSVLVKATVWVRATPPGQINTIDPVARTTEIGVQPALPTQVTVQYNDGSRERHAVTWSDITTEQLAQTGSFEVTGTVSGTGSTTAVATITVTDGSTPQPDTTAPELSIAVSPSTAESGWYLTKPVTVTATATDNVTETPIIEVKSKDSEGAITWVPIDGPLEITDEGLTTLEFRATDEAGNIATADTVNLKVDTISPVSSARIDLTARTVTLRGADEGSGLARIEYHAGDGNWTTYDGVITAPATETTYSLRGVDKAGNVEDSNTVVVPKKGAELKATMLSAKADANVDHGKKLKIKVSVTSSSGKPSGEVEVLDGNTKVATGKVSNGSANLQVEGLEPGKRTLTVRYLGNATYAGSETTVAVTVKKVTSKVNAKVTSKKITPTTHGELSVTVKSPGTAPDGLVTVSSGTKILVADIELSPAGTATVKLPKLKAGTHKITVNYQGSDATRASSKTVTVKVK